MYVISPVRFLNHMTISQTAAGVGRVNAAGAGALVTITHKTEIFNHLDNLASHLCLPMAIAVLFIRPIPPVLRTRTYGQ